MQAHGGFDHNGHTLRTLARIECPYPRFDGLNLTWETLEGLAKHNGPVRHPGWALADIDAERSEEHTSELQSLMRISYAVFCLQQKKYTHKQNTASSIHIYIRQSRIY